MGATNGPASLRSQLPPRDIIVQGILAVVFAAAEPLLRWIGVDACSELGQRWSLPFAILVRGFPFAKAQVQARANWRRLRPRDSPDEVTAGLKRMWQGMGRTAFEYFVLDRVIIEERVSVEGSEHIDAAKAQGRTILFVGVHLGNWEVVAPTLHSLGHGVVTIAQPPRGAADRRLASRARRKAVGAANGPVDVAELPAWPDGARKLARVLKTGDRMGCIYVDEFVEDHVYGPLFGRASRAGGNLARAIRLARMSGAVILPFYALRTTGARYTLTILPAFEPRPGRGEADENDLATLNRILEPLVQANLSQWYWLPNLKFDEADAAPRFAITGWLADGPHEI